MQMCQRVQACALRHSHQPTSHAQRVHRCSSSGVPAVGNSVLIEVGSRSEPEATRATRAALASKRSRHWNFLCGHGCRCCCFAELRRWWGEMPEDTSKRTESKTSKVLRCPRCARQHMKKG